MNILHIVPSYKPAYIYGGPIESVAKLCEGLVGAGNSVSVFTTTANGKSELPIEPNVAIDVDGVAVTYFNRITKDHTHVSPSLWKHLYFNVRKYNVVHIHSWWNVLVIVAAVICYWRGVKVVIAPRGMLSQYIFNSGSSKSKKLIHKLIGKYALSKSLFHATSISEANECKGLINGWKGFVLPNILTLPALTIKKEENEGFSLIFLSRIHPKKGLELLFEAVGKLTFPVTLKIAGSGDEEYIQELKKKAVEMGLQDHIVWLGWQNRETKFHELMKADLFVLVSLNENFANVVVEALHMGTAVLVSEDVALADFIKDNDLGWVTTLDANRIAERLEIAYQDREKRQRIAGAGRGIIESYFSEHRLIRKYIEEYKNLTER